MRDVTPPHVREEIARSQSSRTSKPPRKSQGEVIDADFEMMPQQPETSAVSTKPHQQSQPADPLGLPAPRQI